MFAADLSCMSVRPTVWNRYALLQPSIGQHRSRKVGIVQAHGVKVGAGLACRKVRSANIGVFEAMHQSGPLPASVIC